MSGERSVLNGFCVSSLILGAITFIGTFYFYIVRYVSRDSALLFWFPFFFRDGPILIGLCLGLGIAGVVTCNRHPFYKGKVLGYVGIGLSAAALLHWAACAWLAHIASGYA